MTSQRSGVFAEPVRTAIGTFGGSLKDVPAPTLGAAAIAAAVARAKLRPEEVETVVMGNVVQAGKMNPARQAAFHAELPVTIPNRTLALRSESALGHRSALVGDRSLFNCTLRCSSRSPP